MSTGRKFSFALLPLLPISLAALVWLGSVAFRLALDAGAGEAMLMAWVLAFVVGLPVLIVLLAVIGALQAHHRGPRIIPIMGVKIPGVGR